MASKTDYESAVYIICHIPDTETRGMQAEMWANHFATSNPHFNKAKFLAAIFGE